MKNSIIKIIPQISVRNRAYMQKFLKEIEAKDEEAVSNYADVIDTINNFGYEQDTSLEVDIKRFTKCYKEFCGENI